MAFLPTSVPANFSTPVINGDQNRTNDPQCPHATVMDWHYTLLPAYILLVSVLGIVLNVFVLMVFCFHKKACTVAEIYLTNMAAADLVLMVWLPFWAVYAANRFNWPFGNPLCKLVTLSINMNAYCSIYFLVLISIDRYMALVHPLSHEEIRRPKCAKLGCLLVWVFGLLLGVPTLVYREVSSSACRLNYPGLTILLLFDGLLTTIGFIIPISIISFCTLKIIQALNKRVIDGVNTQGAEQKATTLVLAVLLAFMICWVPFHVVKILLTLQQVEVLSGCNLQRILNICANVFVYFAFFNSVLNPILYVIVGKNFRKKVRELFKQWRFQRTTTYSMSTRSDLTGRVSIDTLQKS